MLGFSSFAGIFGGKYFTPGSITEKISAIDHPQKISGSRARVAANAVILLLLYIPIILNPSVVLAGDNKWKLQDSVTLAKRTGDAYTTVCAAGSSYDSV